MGAPAVEGAPRAPRALARRALRDARVRTIAFAYLFAIYAYIQPVGFRTAYPTAADRLAFAHSFGGNAAIRFFYGYPWGIANVAGYSAWRVGGTLAIAAAVFGVLAGVRPLRAEEEAGRLELVLAGAVSRRTVLAAALAAIAVELLAILAGELAGSLAARLPLAGSVELALATTSVAAVFAGVGALASQLAARRRHASELGMACVGAFLILRVLADTLAGAGWLRWTTPLGWAEAVRPFSDPRPLALLAPALATAALLGAAARLAVRRDIGTGLLAAREDARPRLRGLSSATGQALRGERGSLAIWAASLAAFAVVLGAVSASVSSAGISKALRREIAKLGSGSIVSPTGYLAFVFIFFILAICLFACGQVAAARGEEADERLETLLAEPVGRARWLGGRLALAAGASACLALLAGAVTWAGASASGVHLSLGDALEAGANCVPSALMFLGIAALAFAVLPRASSGIAYGVVAVAFLWYLVGALLDVPHWLVELTPFAHIGFVPVEQFRTGAALAMAAIGAGSAALAVALLRRRDLVGA
ncbi:MAG TPA: hypothetical protein VL977_07290 [Solirubrobacteraceae bacterium]|nr:hypothetical protein [Solirubrobacteraceae bacterium]